MLNKDSFALSNIGLVRLLLNADSRTPFDLPEIIRIILVQHSLGFELRVYMLRVK